MMTSLIPFRRLDQLLDNVFEAGACCADGATDMARVLPRADILEGEKEYRLVMDLPGVDRENVSVELEDQTLTVRGTRQEATPEGFKFLHGERAGRVEFARTFTLGRGVEASGIVARIERGILTVTLPKSEQALPRRIEVN